MWRPRPKTLLSKEQEKAIQKKLKEYGRVFDEEDAAEERPIKRSHSESPQMAVDVELVSPVPLTPERAIARYLEGSLSI